MPEFFGKNSKNESYAIIAIHNWGLQRILTELKEANIGHKYLVIGEKYVPGAGSAIIINADNLTAIAEMASIQDYARSSFLRLGVQSSQGRNAHVCDLYNQTIAKYRGRLIEAKNIEDFNKFIYDPQFNKYFSIEHGKEDA